MMHYGPGMGSGGWFLMWFIALAFVALTVAAVVAVIRPVTRTHAQLPASSAPAEQLLTDRFARGDIDSEEYEQRLRTLRAARAGGPP